MKKLPELEPYPTFREHGYYTKRVIGTLTVVIAIVMGLLALRSILKQEKEPVATQEVVSSAQATDIKTLGSNIDALRHAFAVANNHPSCLEKLQSLRTTGYIENENSDTRQRFRSLKKRPNLLNLSIIHENGDEVTFGVKDDTVWRRSRPSANQPDQVELLSKRDSKAFIEMSGFFGPIFTCILLKEDGISAVAIDRLESHTLIKVQLNPKYTKYKSFAYLDPETLDAYARVDHFSDGSVRKILYNNYTSVAGMREPRTIETYLDDTLTNRTVIESVTANPGLTLSFFELPVEIAPLDR